MEIGDRAGMIFGHGPQKGWKGPQALGKLSCKLTPDKELDEATGAAELEDTDRSLKVSPCVNYFPTSDIASYFLF